MAFFFTIPKNNNISFDVIITGISDVSGFIPYYTAKRKTSDASTLISSIGFIKDPSGIASFSIPSSDTSINPCGFVWDIVLEKDGSIFTPEGCFGEGVIVKGGSILK